MEQVGDVFRTKNSEMERGTIEAAEEKVNTVSHDCRSQCAELFGNFFSQLRGRTHLIESAYHMSDATPAQQEHSPS